MTAEVGLWKEDNMVGYISLHRMEMKEHMLVHVVFVVNVMLTKDYALVIQVIKDMTVV